MVVFAYAVVFKSVELVLAIINLLLVAIPPRNFTSAILFCSDSISNSCFAPLLYPFCLALITIIVLVIWLLVVLSGRILPTADYGSSFLGAACWYAAGGVAIHVVVSWEPVMRNLLGPAIMKAADITVAPGSWYAASVFCMLLAVAYTIDGIVVCMCPNLYSAVIYPPPVLVGVGGVTPMGVGMGYDL